MYILLVCESLGRPIDIKFPADYNYTLKFSNMLISVLV